LTDIVKTPENLEVFHIPQ